MRWLFVDLWFKVESTSTQHASWSLTSSTSDEFEVKNRSYTLVVVPIILVCSSFKSGRN